MNWKNEAVEKLRDYAAMKKAAESLPGEIAQMKAELTAIRYSSSDAPPVKGGGSSYEDRILSRLAKIEEAKRSFYRARNWCKRMDTALEALSADERQILNRCYIYRDSGAIDRLCRDMCCEKSTMYRRRDAALRRFTLALYGSIES